EAHRIARGLLARDRDLEPRHATFALVRLEPGASSDQLPLESHESDSRARSALFRTRRSGDAIDQVVATYFPGPASYTGDDVVELSAHGSPVVLRAIVTAAIAAGARLAEPGEFTLRAFVNGRIDLMQA